MIGDLKPKDIRVTPAVNAAGMGPGGSSPGDVRAVIAFLEESAPAATVVRLNSRARANYFFDGQLRVNQQTNADETRAGFANLEDDFDADGRRAARGVDYYGINIETNG